MELTQQPTNLDFTVKLVTFLCHLFNWNIIEFMSPLSCLGSDLKSPPVGSPFIKLTPELLLVGEISDQHQKKSIDELRWTPY